MQQHNFEPESRIYTHSSDALVDPMQEGKFLPVAFSTFEDLPIVPEGHVLRRTGTSADGDGWEVLEDNRGDVWNTTTEEKTEWNELGPLPTELSKTKPEPLVFKEAKQSKIEMVRTTFAEQIALPVSAASTTWNGGMGSAIAIDGAVRLAEQAGATQIALFDSSNAEHLVDIATGKTIAAAVGQDYQIKLAKKQQLLRDIENATAETLADIVWS